MNEWLKALQTVPRSITTGYSLMALAFMLFAILGVSGKLTSNHIFYLSVGMFAVALLCILWLGAKSTEDDTARESYVDDILSAKLTSYVEFAQRPMFVTDANLIVRFCNHELLSFIGARREDIIDKPVESVIEYFAALVPKSRRSAFLKRQAKVVEEAKKSPYAAISEVVDLGQRVSAIDKRMYRVWIHADFIQAPQGNRALGSVVIYHPVEVIEEEPGKYVLADG